MSKKKPLRTNSDGLGYTGGGHPTRTEPEVYKKQTRALGLTKRFLWVCRFWPDGEDTGAEAARDLTLRHMPFWIKHVKVLRHDWVSAVDVQKGLLNLCGTTNLWKYRPPYAWGSMLPDTRQEVRAVLEVLERGLVLNLHEVDDLVNRQPDGVS